MEDNRMGKGQEQGGLQQRAQRVQREVRKEVEPSGNSLNHLVWVHRGSVSKTGR